MRSQEQQNNHHIRTIRTRRLTLNAAQKDALEKVFCKHLQPNFAEGEYRALIINGVPAQFRNYIWTQLIPNHHHIMPNTYAQLLEQLLQYRQQQTLPINCQISLSPSKQKQFQPNNPAQVRKCEQNPETIAEGSAKIIRWIKVIALDIPRTFPELRIFHNDHEQSQKLANILGCFALYRPDVGYIQGLSLIAALFLQELATEYRAFTALTTLLTTTVLYDFYTFNDTVNQKMCENIMEKLAKRAPQVGQWVLIVRVELKMVVMEWVMTFFTRIFQLDSILNIWDILFAHKVTPAIIQQLCMAIITARKENIQDENDPDAVAKLLRATKLTFSQEEAIFSQMRQVQFADETSE